MVLYGTFKHWPNTFRIIWNRGLEKWAYSRTCRLKSRKNRIDVFLTPGLCRNTPQSDRLHRSTKVLLLHCRKKFEPNQELTDLFNKLWDLDENRCEPGEHYTLNKGGKCCCRNHYCVENLIQKTRCASNLSYCIEPWAVATNFFIRLI